MQRQQAFCAAVGQPLVSKVLEGYNASVIVYGQTGSGKAHTMQGDLSPGGYEQRGLAPRICEELFRVCSGFHVVLLGTQSYDHVYITL